MGSTDSRRSAAVLTDSSSPSSDLSFAWHEKQMRSRLRIMGVQRQASEAAWLHPWRKSCGRSGRRRRRNVAAILQVPSVPHKRSPGVSSFL